MLSGGEFDEQEIEKARQEGDNNAEKAQRTDEVKMENADRRGVLDTYQNVDFKNLFMSPRSKDKKLVTRKESAEIKH